MKQWIEWMEQTEQCIVLKATHQPFECLQMKNYELWNDLKVNEKHERGSIKDL